MAVQQNEEKTSDASVTAGNYHSDGAAQTETVVQKEEICSFGHSPTPKVRKPYTIIKQREKWTEEEHQKFLEALKLYGRGWRQIESHIGTKTAVQIRSHAQKFFSKVVRASSGSTENTIETVEIPPPRPKKKPSHPYPRKKAVDSPNRISVINQFERSPSPNLLVGQKDTESPISVLSASESDSLGSATSEQLNACSSSTSCTTDMHSSTSSPVQKENVHITSISTVQEEKDHFSSTPECFLSMKLELASKDALGNMGDEATGAPITSIKLFGRTVVVTDFLKPCSSGAENSESPTSDKSQENIDTKLVNYNCESLPCQAPDRCMEHRKENADSAGANHYASLPWWTLYQGLPFYYSPAYNQTLVQVPSGSCVEEQTNESNIGKKKSCTSSNSAIINEVENGEKNLVGVDSESQETLHERRISPYKHTKGFVPYKRCRAERDSSSSMMVMEEREGQRTRVCS